MTYSLHHVDAPLLVINVFYSQNGSWPILDKKNYYPSLTKKLLPMYHLRVEYNFLVLTSSEVHSIDFKNVTF
jgi:hypothetical protein